MHVGKTVFAQVVEFGPWKTFGRIIARHRGDVGVRTLGCADVFRIMTFAQLTWRESLRDIEVCLAAHQTKLFHMGLRAAPARATLADALDATTIDWCLNLFDWAPFRSTKAAITLHTLLDLRSAIPAFIHISDGTLHDVNVLDFLPVEAGAFYVMDRGYVDCTRLFALHQTRRFRDTGASVSRIQPPTGRRSFSPTTPRYPR